jgi:hypothetical protein
MIFTTIPSPSSERGAIYKRCYTSHFRRSKNLQGQNTKVQPPSLRDGPAFLEAIMQSYFSANARLHLAGVRHFGSDEI